MLKLSPSQLSRNSSTVMPGMARVAIVPSKHTIVQDVLSGKKQSAVSSFQGNQNQVGTIAQSLLVGGLIGGAIAAFTSDKTSVTRKIGNFPAGIIGATLGIGGILTYTGFQVAKYGGFFDKQRDFKKMFKNL